VGADVEAWWQSVCSNDAATLKSRDRAVRFAFEGAVRARRDAETELRPWIIRHNKATYWSGTQVRRRVRVDGAFAQAPDSVESQGVPIPADQLLPFFLAARSASGSSRDLLGVALSSSYEAFRHTRQDRRAVLDEQEEPVAEHEVGMHSRWYLEEFDRALEKLSGSIHPKISPSVERIVDLWEGGEKVLVFGFYRHTCSALRVHISREIERRLFVTVRRRLKGTGPRLRKREIRSLLKTIQRRYFDDADAPGRRAVDAALMQIVETRKDALDRVSVSQADREKLVDVMRRFLRVQTTLARCFPIRELETIDPALAVLW
jgi:hypothetical protein